MNGLLSYSYGPSGIDCTIRSIDKAHDLAIDKWALCDSVRDSHSHNVSVGVLLRLREDELAHDLDPATLRVPWLAASRLSHVEMRSLGLPPPAPLTLEIRASGALSDQDFQLSHGFRHPNGRPAVAVQRQGALITLGQKTFLLPFPLYPLVDEVEAVNAEEMDLEERFLAWGRISEHLPEDSVVDEHIRNIRVAVASSFSLLPFLGEGGEPDFDPVLGYFEEVDDPTAEQGKRFSEILPKARQGEFARRFRGLRKVKGRYATGAETYIVLDSALERALRAVKQAQLGSSEEKIRFLENPSVFVRESLESGDTAEFLLDTIFHDEGLSDRVKGIGIWQPKVVPWVKRATEPWLPPEELGVRVGDTLVHVAPRDVDKLLLEIESARQCGDSTITYKGDRIPATKAAQEALEALLPEIRPTSGDARASRKISDGNIERTLLVIDNLGQVDYERTFSARQGRPGGIPETVKAKLYPHQVEGLLWLQSHWCKGSPGALLADDMGLGKTVEALAFLAWLREEMRLGRAAKRPFLVVAPTGLLKIWQDEHDIHLTLPGLGELIEAHGTGLKELKIGSRQDRGELDTGIPSLDTRALDKSEWVMTTYETLRDYQHSFARIHWAVIVFDEAQKIKNPAARLTVAALAMNTNFAVTMTGTPVENRPADLWTIVDRAQPGRLGSLKDFSNNYESDDDGSGKSLTGLRDLLVHESSPPIMLRRLKEDHLKDLPDKKVHVDTLKMPSQQAEEYRLAVESSQADKSVLSALQRIRSISLHPYTYVDVTEEQYIRDAARLTLTFRILDDIAERDEKALIFVEFLKMQGFLLEAIQRRYGLAEPILVVNGTVSGSKRKLRVDAFQKRPGFDAMILSPRAGGVGLTLTAANHVIHLSRWWNPAVEDQCTDRAHRIGQDRCVHVYYPIAIHPEYEEYSFDLRLDDLLTKKRKLNRAVLAPTAPSKKDMETLYNLTVTDAHREGATTEKVTDLEAIDAMEPIAFEEWVLKQLAKAGYRVRKTPYQDGGADGVAYREVFDESHAVFIQCKHTQGEGHCDHHAVEEVIRSRERYDQVKADSVFMLVVTNAYGFTKKARQTAKDRGVELIDRRELSKLQRFSTSSC